jgi:hypothetical protein
MLWERNSGFGNSGRKNGLQNCRSFPLGRAHQYKVRSIFSGTFPVAEIPAFRLSGVPLGTGKRKKAEKRRPQLYETDDK